MKRVNPVEEVHAELRERSRLYIEFPNRNAAGWYVDSYREADGGGMERYRPGEGWYRISEDAVDILHREFLALRAWFRESSGLRPIGE
jgi:hypothetical protein